MERKLMARGLGGALALALVGGWTSGLSAAVPVTSSGTPTSSGSPAPAAKPMSEVVPDSALSTVRWSNGRSLSLESMRGKTVILMGFVTWCPICNGWSPEMLAGVKKESADKPVIVLTIATDVDVHAAQDYMLKHQFSGQNIGYGSDPNFNKTFGLNDKDLWTFAWIGPDGKIKRTGQAGGFYPGPNNTKTFVLPSELSKERDLGKFDFITAGMDDTVKGLLWPMELGDLSKLPLLAQPKNLRGFTADDQKMLAEVGTKFLDEQLARVKELIAGGVAEKIDGYEKASHLAPAFRGTAQGKELGKIVADLNADKTFKKELGAWTAYNKGLAMAGGDDVKLAKQMRGIATRFPDTYYGEKAKEAADTKPLTK